MRQETFTIGFWSLIAALAFAPAAGCRDPEPVKPPAEEQMYFFTAEAWQMRQTLIYGPYSPIWSNHLTGEFDSVGP